MDYRELLEKYNHLLSENRHLINENDRLKRWGSSLLLSAPIKTGKELGMKESYGEGLANHTGPESCADDGNITGEGTKQGQVSTFDILRVVW